jgi:hypothetical protein
MEGLEGVGSRAEGVGMWKPRPPRHSQDLVEAAATKAFARLADGHGIDSRRLFAYTMPIRCPRMGIV